MVSTLNLTSMQTVEQMIEYALIQTFKQESYNQPYNPSYDSYGAPQAPAYQPGNNDFGYTGGSGYYANFYNDLELTMKVGQVALIAFILLVAVVVCFLLLMCCMYCPTLFGGGYRGQPQPETGGYYPTNIQGMDYSENDNLEKNR